MRCLLIQKVASPSQSFNHCRVEQLHPYCRVFFSHDFELVGINLKLDVFHLQLSGKLVYFLSAIILLKNLFFNLKHLLFLHLQQVYLLDQIFVFFLNLGKYSLDMLSGLDVAPG